MVKTLTNSWATTYRYHEAQLLTCVFGCRSRHDDLKHYISCSKVWPLIEEATRVPYARVLSERLGIVSPNPIFLKQIGVAFTIYHTLRNKHSGAIALAHARNDFSTVRILALGIGRVAARDFML